MDSPSSEVSVTLCSVSLLFCTTALLFDINTAMTDAEVAAQFYQAQRRHPGDESPAIIVSLIVINICR